MLSFAHWGRDRLLALEASLALVFPNRALGQPRVEIRCLKMSAYTQHMLGLFKENTPNHRDYTPESQGLYPYVIGVTPL